MDYLSPYFEQQIKMSNAKANLGKSPDPKLARYLHRIQQIIGHRSRSTSPISSRINRPLKANNLDHFLRYEIRFKILGQFVDKVNKGLMRAFFNNLRVHAVSKVQKIYKFVPIQKIECAHMIVDPNISTKILVNILKIKLKAQLKKGFESIKLYVSHLQKVNNIVNLNKYNKSTVFASISHITKPNLIIFVLQKIFTNRKSLSFRKINLEAVENKSLKSKKQVINGFMFAKIILLNKLFSTLKKNKLKLFFSQINIIQKYEIEQQFLKELSKQNFRYISSHYFQRKKNQLLRSVIRIRPPLVFYEQKSHNFLEVQTKDQKFEQNDIIYEAMTKINVALIAILVRRKADVMRVLERRIHEKKRSIKQMITILSQKILKDCSFAFKSIQIIHYHSKNEDINNQQKQIYEKMIFNKTTKLLFIESLFTSKLKDYLNQIKKISNRTKKYQESIKIIQRFLNKQSEKAKLFFECFKIHKKQQIAAQSETKQLLNNKKYFFQILQKLYSQKLVHSFLQIKHCKKILFDFKNNRKTEWIKDIQNFLQQRNRFHKKAVEKFSTIESNFTKNTTQQFSSIGNIERSPPPILHFSK